jgi:perosamine synthetase
MRKKSTSQDTAGSRRDFLKSSCALAAVAGAGATATRAAVAAPSEALALHGGPKAVSIGGSDAWRWPRYGQAEEEAVLALVRRPSYDPIAALEKDWQEKFDAKHVRAYSSGTGALTAMFFALDLPPGSEIMVPSYTFFATIVPMRNFGLVPLFVDINPRTLNFDVEDAKKRLTKNTRAVLPVHWMGLPCDMDEICDWANQKGLIVLEDAAHAHGAKLQGKLMGNWSRMSIFSFQTTKPLPALEGGVGVYQEQDDCDRATAYSHYDQCSGKYAKYKGSGLGMKLRMHPMAAAMARTQLTGLADRNAAGVAQVRRLNERLTQLPGLFEQQTRSDCERIYYSSNKLYIDEAKAGMSRAACVKALQAEGVRASASSYPLQHKMPLYAEAQWWHHPPLIPDLPGSEQANATAISLPYFTSEQPELVEQYALAFEKVWAHRKQLAG